MAKISIYSHIPKKEKVLLGTVNGATKQQLKTVQDYPNSYTVESFLDTLFNSFNFLQWYRNFDKSVPGIWDVASNSEFDGSSNEMDYETILRLINKYYLVFEVIIELPEQLGASGTFVFSATNSTFVFEIEKSICPADSTFIGELMQTLFNSKSNEHGQIFSQLINLLY